VRFLVYGSKTNDFRWQNRMKREYSLLVVALGLLAISFAASCGMTAISSLNYPGGHALARLHQIVPAAKQGSNQIFHLV
jgi:alpha-1,6-mannosyltransferase